MNKHLSELVRVSQTWGEDVFLVQGPGGNTSFKLRDRMWIKSSGFLLKDMKLESGLTEVNLDTFRHLKIPSVERAPYALEEAQYVQIIKNSSMKTAGQSPSMEVGLHAILPHSWVLHVHSLAGILIGLVEDKAEWLKIEDWFKAQNTQVIVINPCIPGLQLAWEVKRALFGRDLSKSLFIVLRNHGIVWASNSLKLTEETSARFEEKFRALWKLPRFSLPVWEGETELSFDAWEKFSFSSKSIFPDFSVFFPDPAEQLSVSGKKVVIKRETSRFENTWLGELLFAHGVVETVSKGYGIYRPLDEAITLSINQLEIEKLRLSNIKGCV